MKIKNIFLAGLSAVALASCSDYLDTDAPSKIFPEEVFTDVNQTKIALNGVYASMLTGDTYGKTFLKELCFNTDVDFAMTTNRYFSGTSYRRYEADPDGSHIKKAWDALYKGIERANMVINGIQKSDLYNADELDKVDANLMQYLGEAMVLRAIFYHDLIWYFGDVPYTRTPSFENKSTIYDVADRTFILDDMIKDLEWIAPYMMQSDSRAFTDGVERISQEMAWAMITRLAMTAGGYSLRPEGGKFGTMKRPENLSVTFNGETRTFNWETFYDTAIQYARMVRDESNHSLNKDYYKVFVDECNFISSVGDDVIFEIPFGKESTGSIGYIHGPKMDNSQGTTPHAWGKADSSAQLNAFYRYMFDEDDERRDYVNQLFGYNQNGESTFNNGRTVYNGKWSKLWNTNGLGAASEDNTGINFPYMRYADVLLMLAEAINERNQGPDAEAIQALEDVRARAFRSNPIKARYRGANDYAEFRDAVLDERKYEFAGENMRWRDLVRNNMLSENTYWNFMRYYNQALNGQYYDDEISIHDFKNEKTWTETFVTSIFYHNNFPDGTFVYKGAQKDNDFTPWAYTERQFPMASNSLKITWVLNPYDPKMSLGDGQNYVTRDRNDSGKVVDFKHTPGTANVEWSTEDGIRDYILYSLRGYIYQDEGSETGGMPYINDNGTYVVAPNPDSDLSNLPVVRYILPYPRAVITRSMGKYENKYGYL